MSTQHNQPAGGAPEHPTGATPTEAGNRDLGHSLKVRHLTMMGLGSAIGAGLFLGTGVGINAAGPAVLLSYVVAGVIVVFVMRMLGELAAARPASGTFATYAKMALGPWAGFSMGWLYWFMLIMVMGAEIAGAGAIMGNWFGVEGWIPGLACVVLFTVINLFAVRGFGEFEYWFAFVKVAVIVFFLVVGALLIFGLLPGHDPVGVDNFTPFAPHGVSGIAAGLLAVAFAFGGIEIVTIAAAESEKPSQAIAAAVRAVVWRISVFYLGSVLVIVALLNFATLDDADDAADSPFTQVLALADIPGVVGFMEAIIVLALLSAFNAQIYGTSRMAFQLAREGDAPRWLGVTNGNGVPTNAVILSVVFAFAAVGLQMWNPPGLLDFLMNAVGGCLIVTWVMITLSYIKLHPQMQARGENSAVQVHGDRWVPWVTLAALVGLTLLMLADASTRSQIVSVLVVSAVIVAISFLTRGKAQSDAQDALS